MGKGVEFFFFAVLSEAFWSYKTQNQCLAGDVGIDTDICYYSLLSRNVDFRLGRGMSIDGILKIKILSDVLWHHLEQNCTDSWPFLYSFAKRW